MKERKFFTVSQLIEYFGNGVISRGTIYLMVKKGEIPTVHRRTYTYSSYLGRTIYA